LEREVVKKGRFEVIVDRLAKSRQPKKRRNVKDRLQIEKRRDVVENLASLVDTPVDRDDDLAWRRRAPLDRLEADDRFLKPRRLFESTRQPLLVVRGQQLPPADLVKIHLDRVFN